MTDESNLLYGMQQDIASLRESRGALVVSVQTLTDQVTKLANTVETLNSTIDKSRGALWVIGSVSGGLAATVAALITGWFQR